MYGGWRPVAEEKALTIDYVFERMIDLAWEHDKISKKRLLGARRDNELVIWRCAISYFLKAYNQPLKTIARKLRKANHATIINLLKKVQQVLDKPYYDPELYRVYKIVEKDLLRQGILPK